MGRNFFMQIQFYIQRLRGDYFLELFIAFIKPGDDNRIGSVAKKFSNGGFFCFSRDENLVDDLCCMPLLTKKRKHDLKIKQRGCTKATSFSMQMKTLLLLLLFGSVGRSGCHFSFCCCVINHFCFCLRLVCLCFHFYFVCICCYIRSS